MIKRIFKTITGVLSKSEGEGVPCHFCPIHIFIEHEAGNTIHYKDGYPICARCRVLNGKNSSIIIGDKTKRDADVSAMNEKVQRTADKDVLVVAEKTQRQTGTKRR